VARRGGGAAKAAIDPMSPTISAVLHTAVMARARRAGWRRVRGSAREVARRADSSARRAARASAVERGSALASPPGTGSPSKVANGVRCLSAQHRADLQPESELRRNGATAWRRVAV
jgi:hypothetical protein